MVWPTWTRYGCTSKIMEIKTYVSQCIKNKINEIRHVPFIKWPIIIFMLPSASACNLQTTQQVSCITSSDAQFFLRHQHTSQGMRAWHIHSFSLSSKVLNMEILVRIREGKWLQNEENNFMETSIIYIWHQLIQGDEEKEVGMWIMHTQG